jgi:hypothetical protein
VWKNKEGEKGEVVRNKSRLVAQGFSQKEGIDYEETFAPVARLEAIRILLAFSVAKGFKLHQMDLKSAFLNGVLEEEVYVRQPLGFESEKYPHRVYKLRKALLLTPKFGRQSDLWVQRGEESVWQKEGFVRRIRQKSQQSAIRFRSARKTVVLILRDCVVTWPERKRRMDG